MHSGHAHSAVYIEYCFSNIFVCLHTKLRPTLKNKKVGKTVRNLLCAFALCTSYLSKNSVNEWLWNLLSGLHTKNHLSDLKNKKVGKTVCNEHCAKCVCTVRTQFFKKYCVRIIEKAEIMPENQITALKCQLCSLAWKIKKKLGNSAQCALHCAVSMCTLLTLFVKIAI